MLFRTGGTWSGCLLVSVVVAVVLLTEVGDAAAAGKLWPARKHTFFGLADGRPSAALSHDACAAADGRDWAGAGMLYMHAGQFHDSAALEACWRDSKQFPGDIELSSILPNGNLSMDLFYFSRDQFVRPETLPQPAF